MGEKNVFILICGEGVNAAKAGALHLLTTCPGAPILLIDECVSLSDDKTFLVERAIEVSVDEFDLLHANPVPIEKAPTSVPDNLLLNAASASGFERRVIASCDVEAPFATQRDWLRRHYQVDALDASTQSVGQLIDEHDGRWLSVMTVAFDATGVRPVLEAMCESEAR